MEQLRVETGLIVDEFLSNVSYYSSQVQVDTLQIKTNYGCKVFVIVKRLDADAVDKSLIRSVFKVRCLPDIRYNLTMFLKSIETICENIYSEKYGGYDDE